MTGLDFVLAFTGIVCAAFALPFVVLAVARVIKAGTRHLDR